MAQRPFHGSLKAPPDAGPVVCSLIGFVPRNIQRAKEKSKNE